MLLSDQVMTRENSLLMSTLVPTGAFSRHKHLMHKTIPTLTRIWTGKVKMNKKCKENMNLINFPGKIMRLITLSIKTF